MIAAGLNSVNEFYYKAKKFGIDVYSAGDSREIAEASAAIFSGKIEGKKIITSLNGIKSVIPKEWYKKMEVLRSEPKNIYNDMNFINNKLQDKVGFSPVFHCYQEIPCNPCSTICPEDIIKMSGKNITGVPYLVNKDCCSGCMSCIYICPGLAISFVDNRKNNKKPTITIPYEIGSEQLRKGEKIIISDNTGIFVKSCEIKRIIKNKKFKGTILVQFEIDRKYSKKALGIKFKKNEDYSLVPRQVNKSLGMSIVCRCERITDFEIRSMIAKGITDINQIKSVTRVGMGSCGSKNCHALVWQIFKEEKINIDKITDLTIRPLFIEVPIGVLAAQNEEINEL